MEATTAALVDLLEARAERMPESALAAARRLTLDFLGVAVAGGATDEGRLIRSVLGGLRGPGPCDIPLGGHTFDPATAALVTGTMGYSIGLTDTHAQSITHPGPSVIPAALAVGQAVGASAERVLTAIVLGFETVVRVGSVVNPSHRARGFHPTATCNPFGAAVAAAYLLGAGREQTLWALGLAGSTAGGLYEFRHSGAMLMALHGGWPASSGVTAAYLAAGGFTGPDTVLEGPEGFFRAFADETRPELLIPPAGGPLGIEEVSLRPYCACRYGHAGVDALQQINETQGPVEPEAIERLTVFTHSTAVDQETEPTSLVGARLSTRFTVARAAVYGPLLDEVTVKDLTDPAVIAVADRTEVVEDPELTALFPRRWACRVVVRTKDGREYERRVDIPKGEPENPLTEAEIAEKFRRLAGPALGEAPARELADAIAGLGRGTELNTVLDALARPAREGERA